MHFFFDRLKRSIRRKSQKLPNETIASLPVGGTRILGLGGAGCNLLNCETELWNQAGVTIGINTDLAGLQDCVSLYKLLVGQNTCKGKGCNGSLEKGLTAAKESKIQLAALVQGGDKLVLMAGLGGGTGTGVLVYISRIARSLAKNLTVYATLPFNFEGQHRLEVAKQALDEITWIEDLHIFDNNEILGQDDSELTMEQLTIHQSKKIIGNVFKKSLPKGTSPR